MLKIITKMYRVYAFYSSPHKYIVRKSFKIFFRQCEMLSSVLEVGGGNAMMRGVIEKMCKVESYVSSDIVPGDAIDVVCDAQKMPFNNSTFDMVTAFEVIEHIPCTERFLSEIERVLKPGGYAVFSMPFLYGRHDFQDFYRWTEQGLDRVLNNHGLEIKIINKRGGTFLAIATLLLNYVHSVLSPSKGGWRANGFVKKLYFGIMSIVLFPVVVMSWLGYGMDLLIDSNSDNASGFVCIAQKQTK